MIPNPVRDIFLSYRQNTRLRGPAGSDSLVYPLNVSRLTPTPGIKQTRPNSESEGKSFQGCREGFHLAAGWLVAGSTGHRFIGMCLPCRKVMSHRIRRFSRVAHEFSMCYKQGRSERSCRDRVALCFSTGFWTSSGTSTGMDLGLGY